MIDQTLVRNKSNSQSSKKVGCPAAISISKIATFPKFKVSGNVGSPTGMSPLSKDS